MRFHRYVAPQKGGPKRLKLKVDIALHQILSFLSSHFAITTLWPPLHTRKEIEFVLDKFFRHPERQTRRLHEIMKGPVH